MRQDKKKISLGEYRTNTGSAVIEVTLIMPLILMVIVLLITMLLSVLQQAQVHASLILEHVDEYGTGIEICQDMAQIELVKGYPISSEEVVKAWKSSVDRQIRRWQIFGDVDSDGGASSISDIWNKGVDD